MPGRLSLNRYTKAVKTRPVTPSQTPATFRRISIRTKPTIAKASRNMFQKGGRWKNMSQYEVNEPFPGSPLYFMSVI